ncbi:MAG: hypothetical protein C0483_24195 [Pirellula sp.]|nr:hypothetical protein [Pirellula sp.]
MAWLALFVSLVSGSGTIWNATTSNRNYDRLSGRTRAQLVMIDSVPAQEDVPEGLLQKSPIFDEQVLTLSDVDDFFRLNPRLLFKNVGDEPIGDIRLETRLGFSFIDMIGEPEERQRKPTPWAYEDATRDDYVLGEKLFPEHIVEVSIVRGLLDQMTQLQATDRADRWHYGQFDIRCMGKLVNGGGFDSTDYSQASVNFRWKPAGFPQDKCKKVLEKLRHVPVVRQTK